MSKKSTKLFLFFYCIMLIVNISISVNASITSQSEHSPKLVTISPDNYIDSLTVSNLTTGKEIFFNITFTFPTSYNFTHNFYIESITKMYFNISRGQSYQSYGLNINCKRNDGVWVLIAARSLEQWASLGGYTTFTDNNRFFHRENDNQFSIQMRMLFYQEILKVDYVSLYYDFYLEGTGSPEALIVGDVVSTIIDISIFAIIIIIIPAVLGKVFGIRGVGMGFLLMSFIGYIIYSNIIITIIIALIGLLLLFKKESV